MRLLIHWAVRSLEIKFIGLGFVTAEPSLDALSRALLDITLNAQVTRTLVAPGFLLQGMAAAICLSKFLLAFLMMS